MVTYAIGDVQGCGATLVRLHERLRAEGWSERGITLDGLDRLRREVVEARHTSRLELPGMAPERAEILPGGLAILIAAFEGLHIGRMDITPASLREGLLYDLVGRIRHEDARQRTIRQFSQRYHVDLEHAARVERAALAFLEQVSRAWDLGGEDIRQMLAWAARLHEIGLSVSFTGHHKHGAYIARHADMPGFSREEQQVLAALVGSHRRRLQVEDFRALPAAREQEALRLCVLLRLAVCLTRGRSPRPLPAVKLKAAPRRLRVAFPRGWLARHPLTRADLVNENAVWRSAGLTLSSA